MTHKSVTRLILCATFLALGVAVSGLVILNRELNVLPSRMHDNFRWE